MTNEHLTCVKYLSVLFLSVLTLRFSCNDASSPRELVDYSFEFQSLDALPEILQNLGSELEKEILAGVNGQIPDQELSIRFQSMGQFYLAQEYFEPANRAFSKAVDLDSKSFEASYFLAEILKNQGQVEKAQVKFEAAYEINSEYAPLYSKLGELYLASGDVKMAEEMFVARTVVDENSVSAKVGLGRIALQQNDLEKAENFAREAISDAPSRRETHALMASVLRAQGKGKQLELYANQSDLPRLVESDSLLDSIDRFKDPSRIALLEADLLYLAGKFRDARIVYFRATELDPNNEVAWKNLAVTYLRENDPASAKTILRKGLDELPNGILLLETLSQIEKIEKGLVD